MGDGGCQEDLGAAGDTFLAQSPKDLLLGRQAERERAASSAFV